MVKHLYKNAKFQEKNTKASIFVNSEKLSTKWNPLRSLPSDKLILANAVPNNKLANENLLKQIRVAATPVTS